MSNNLAVNVSLCSEYICFCYPVKPIHLSTDYIGRDSTDKFALSPPPIGRWKSGTAGARPAEESRAKCHYSD